MTDYRALLIKYIDHVGECEGVTFVSHADPDPKKYGTRTVTFTAEEYAALLECEEVSRAARHQRYGPQLPPTT